jgi:hypothetical protein
MQFKVGDIVHVYSIIDSSKVAAIIVEVKGFDFRVKYLHRIDAAPLWYSHYDILDVVA